MIRSENIPHQNEPLLTRGMKVGLSKVAAWAVVSLAFPPVREVLSDSLGHTTQMPAAPDTSLAFAGLVETLHQNPANGILAAFSLAAAGAIVHMGHSIHQKFTSPGNVPVLEQPLPETMSSWNHPSYLSQFGDRAN